MRDRLDGDYALGAEVFQDEVPEQPGRSLAHDDAGLAEQVGKAFGGEDDGAKLLRH